jgi:hypothetical protein
VAQASDAENPEDPALVGANANLGEATDVAVSGSYAYVTGEGRGLSVVSALNPTYPYELEFLSTFGSALGVDVETVLSTKYAFVADGDEGLQVISVQSPQSPVLTGKYDTPGWASDVVVATLAGEPYACIADGDSGLRLINVTPTGPPRSTIFSDDFEDELADWTESGTVEWYTGTPKNGTHAARLRTTASIEQTISTVDFEDISVSFALGVSGLDAGEDVRVEWWDGLDWNEVVLVEAGDLAEDRLYSFYEALGADADDNPDFLLRFEINCSGPADAAYVDDVVVAGDPVWEPHGVGFYNTPGQARGVGVAVGADYAYACVADGNTGLQILDVTQPAQPLWMSALDTSGWAESVAVSNIVALIADGEAGLRVVDFSTPTAPAEIAYYDTPGWSGDVAALNGHAYLIDETWGLTILGMWHAFRDVKFDYWAYRYIEAIAEAGISQGYPDEDYGRLYWPTLAVTRAQMAVFVARAAADGDENVPDGPPVAVFSDVPTDHWAYKYVEYCYANEIVEGYTASFYGPTITVTRDQMAVFIARARGWVVLGQDMATEDYLFPDVLEGHWAGAAIKACVDNGVVKGYLDGYYRPGRQVTRDEMAVYIARGFELPI